MDKYLRGVLRIFGRFFIKTIYKILDPIIPFYRTSLTQSPVTFKIWFTQKVLGINGDAYWPVHWTSTVTHAKNILIGVDAAAGISPGCYIQGGGKICIGDYTQIGPNVGVISANHDVYDNSKHINSEVIIGDYCWIGMNSVILPGVELGDFTIVGAGSIVTKSFPDGHCVIGGNPAKLIKKIEPQKCIKQKNEYEFHGYIANEKFNTFRERNLNV